MKTTLKELADILGAQVIGDPATVITGIAGIKEAREGDITFISSPKYMDYAYQTKASAIISSEEMKDSLRPILKTAKPSLALAKIASLFFSDSMFLQKGIHPTAVVGENVSMGQDVSIGAYAVIGNNVTIGNKCCIWPYVYVGDASSIGGHCKLYSHVSIREKTTIGDRVIIQNGAVIGSDGFGYETEDSKHYKVPQLGTVVVEDDVEIGANVTIDRARLDKTIIGKGTKIDNLVHIAHNVLTGKNCIIVAQVGISGSVTIGDNVVLAGQAGIAGHLTIGDNAIVGGQAGVTKSVPAHTFVSGYPAQPHKEAAKINAYVQRLPGLYAVVDGLKASIGQKKTHALGRRTSNKRISKHTKHLKQNKKH